MPGVSFIGMGFIMLSRDFLFFLGHLKMTSNFLFGINGKLITFRYSPKAYQAGSSSDGLPEEDHLTILHVFIKTWLSYK